METGSGATVPPPPRTRRERLFAAWRRRRLRVGDLAPRARVHVLATLAACALAGALILVVGAGLGPPGGSVLMAIASEGTLRPVPRAAILVFHLGLAGSAASLAWAAISGSWRFRQLTLLGIGLLGASVAGQTANAWHFLRSSPPPIGEEPVIVLVAGVAGVIASAALAFVPWRRVPSAGVVAPVLAAAPFVLALVAYAASLVGGAPAGLDLNPREFYLFNFVAIVPSEITLLTSTLLLLWGIIASTKAARDGGLSALLAGRRFRGFLAALVGAKIAGLVLGYAGLFPAWLGGGQRWDDSLHGGVVPWVLATAFVGAGVWWVLFGDRRLSDRGFTAAAWAVVLGSLSFTIVFGLGALAEGAVAVWPSVAPLRFLHDNVVVPLSTPTTRLLWPVALAPFVALAAGAFLRRRPAGIFLLLFGAWSLLRGLNLTLGLTDARPPLRVNPDVVTTDAVVTLGVLVLAVLWWTGRQRVVSPPILVVVLVTSTLIAHPGFWLPTGWKTGMLFYASLVFPVAYRFLFDAGGLNEQSPTRSTKVVAGTAMAAGLLTLVAFQVSLGAVGPDRQGPLSGLVSDVGVLWLMMPFAALLLGALLRPADEQQVLLPAPPARPNGSVAPGREAGES